MRRWMFSEVDPNHNPKESGNHRHLDTEATLNPISLVLYGLEGRMPVLVRKRKHRSTKWDFEVMKENLQGLNSDRHLPTAPVHSPNSLINRCRYERLMPSRFAAAILLPPSASSAPTISRRLQALISASKVYSLATPAAGMTFSILSGRNSR